jgi:L-amino acid N-acyltransferase YncA
MIGLEPSSTEHHERHGLSVSRCRRRRRAGLAQLHVTTFVETHGGPGPTFSLREGHWREAFSKRSDDWFCVVINDPDGELVGFAKGVPHQDIPGYAGEVNKIYILRRYHRLGLGKRLLGEVSRRFLAHGIASMLLFGDARNPSNGFHERMGAERLFAPDGTFHGGYGWRDIRPLPANCEPRRGTVGESR